MTIIEWSTIRCTRKNEQFLQILFPADNSTVAIMVHQHSVLLSDTNVVNHAHLPIYKVILLQQKSLILGCKCKNLF